MAAAEEFKRLNTRKASVLQIGRFRPTQDPCATHFGKAPLASLDETWPDYGDDPMMAICQLNLGSAPAVPPLLSDVRILTFFIAPEAALGRENGEGWCLRTYGSTDGLRTLTMPPDAPKIAKGFECLWHEQDDHPHHDDPEVVRVPGARWPQQGFDNVMRSKVGGYVSTIQSEPWWDCGSHPAEPRYCLQIDSEEKLGLAWGDAGCLYLARGGAAGQRQRWFLDWQCY